MENSNVLLKLGLTQKMLTLNGIRDELLKVPTRGYLLADSKVATHNYLLVDRGLDLECGNYLIQISILFSYPLQD